MYCIYVMFNILIHNFCTYNGLQKTLEGCNVLIWSEHK